MDFDQMESDIDEALCRIQELEQALEKAECRIDATHELLAQMTTTVQVFLSENTRPRKS